MFSRLCLNSARRLSTSFSVHCKEVPSNPDVFGTLSGSKIVRSAPETLAGPLETLNSDQDDEQEEQFLSFTAGDRKSPTKMKEEIWTLVKSNRLKEALKLFEVERKADKVQPLRGMYSHLIGNRYF